MKKATIIIASGFALFAACTPDPTPTSPSCVAGSGGKTTVLATLYHHHLDSIVPNIPGHPDTIYVKYNAVDLPRTASGGIDYKAFELIAVGTAPDTIVTIKNLKCGNYFLFGAGFTEDDGRVIGGIKLNVPTNDSSVIKISVPVSED